MISCSVNKILSTSQHYDPVAFSLTTFNQELENLKCQWTCAICLEPPQIPFKPIKSKSRSIYHAQCILEWFKSNSTDPSTRQKLSIQKLKNMSKNKLRAFHSFYEQHPILHSFIRTSTFDPFTFDPNQQLIPFEPKNSAPVVIKNRFPNVDNVASIQSSCPLVIKDSFKLITQS